jgi:hypothetical protein
MAKPVGAQRTRTGGEGGAGRHHVVHQQHHVPGGIEACAARPRPARPRDCERPHHVGRAVLTIQGRLRRRVSHAPEQGNDRQAKTSCDEVGLIETARSGLARVQRDGHDQRRTTRYVMEHVARQRGKGRGQRLPAVVLQGVEDRAQGAVIRANAPRPVEAGGTLQTTADGAWQGGQATPRTPRWHVAHDAGPACSAHRTGGGMCEEDATRRARRREQQRQRAIDQARGAVVRRDRRARAGAPCPRAARGRRTPGRLA